MDQIFFWLKRLIQKVFRLFENINKHENIDRSLFQVHFNLVIKNEKKT